MIRRDFLRAFSGLLLGGMLMPLHALAAVWNKAAFDSKTLKEAESGLQIPAETVSSDIEIIAPDKAENGAVVQVEISSRIAATESIAILVEKNPTALIAHYAFSNGALPYVVTRIKMAETSDIKVVVQAGGQYFTASRRVEVLENGCG